MLSILICTLALLASLNVAKATKKDDLLQKIQASKHTVNVFILSFNELDVTIENEKSRDLQSLEEHYKEYQKTINDYKEKLNDTDFAVCQSKVDNFTSYIVSDELFIGILWEYYMYASTRNEINATVIRYSGRLDNLEEQANSCTEDDGDCIEGVDIAYEQDRIQIHEDIRNFDTKIRSKIVAYNKTLIAVVQTIDSEVKTRANAAIECLQVLIDTSSSINDTISEVSEAVEDAIASFNELEEEIEKFVKDAIAITNAYSEDVLKHIFSNITTQEKEAAKSKTNITECTDQKVQLNETKQELVSLTKNETDNLLACVKLLVENATDTVKTYQSSAEALLKQLAECRDEGCIKEVKIKSEEELEDGVSKALNHIDVITVDVFSAKSQVDPTILEKVFSNTAKIIADNITTCISEKLDPPSKDVKNKLF